MTDTTWTVLGDLPCHLGESAVWDDRAARLHWVDITAGLVHTLDWAGGPTRTIDVGDMVGSVALREDGGLVMALRHAVAYLDPDAGWCEVVAAVEADRPGNRCNDGAVDPAGRFWFGTMDLAETDPTGSFYCLSPGGTPTAVFDGIICSNGPAWSPDGRTMYHVDSTRQVVRAHPFDPDTGEAGPGSVFVDDTGTGWYPDGVTVDAEGYVWNCKWAGGRIVRYALTAPSTVSSSCRCRGPPGARSSARTWRCSPSPAPAWASPTPSSRRRRCPARCWSSIRAAPAACRPRASRAERDGGRGEAGEEHTGDGGEQDAEHRLRRVVDDLVAGLRQAGEVPRGHDRRGGAGDRRRHREPGPPVIAAATEVAAANRASGSVTAPPSCRPETACAPAIVTRSSHGSAEATASRSAANSAARLRRTDARRPGMCGLYLRTRRCGRCPGPSRRRCPAGWCWRRPAG
ncbi:SMP-30/gluconolactonase/LRE family protein [Dactylosporangium darangshiense]|uniref:SMP-30/gluconolactonase/LRE family protein n=1 Tax=Dactylosporangium darangshiense TaxID=579108 RepID=UPI00362DE6D7